MKKSLEIKRPEKIIDMHSHLFNLKYLPVAGIIMRYKNVKPNLANGLAKILLRRTGESFPRMEEQPEFVDKPAVYSMPVYDFLKQETFSYDAIRILDFDISDAYRALEQMPLVGDFIEGDLAEALEEYRLENEAGMLSQALVESDSLEEKIRDLFGRFRRMLENIIGKKDCVKNHVNWFILMTKSEEEIYSILHDVDAQGVERYLHLMMDVDHYFGEGSRSSYDFVDVQIDNMVKLHQRHKELIGFVAFSPARKENSLEVVKLALSEKGFKGVKFYPPMGYKASGDSRYKDEINELMAFCSANKIPVFTHCNNQGFEAWPKESFPPNERPSGYDSNPIYWEELLIKYPDLILCLGHAGGGEGWFSNHKPDDIVDASRILAKNIADESGEQKDWNKSYAAMVFKLCVIHKNVYCDFSYLDEMIRPDGTFVPELYRNFKTRLLRLFKDNKIFSSKIMYGSDWHMLFREGKNRIYLDKYIEFFSDNDFDDFDDFQNKFFYKNAVSFLNL